MFCTKDKNGIKKKPTTKGNIQLGSTFTNKLVKANDISVSEEELFEYAFILSKNQFYQYGLTNIPDEHIENYTKEQLAKPEEARRLREQKFDEKIISFVKETVKLDKKNITMEKFRKLFEEDK